MEVMIIARTNVFISNYTTLLSSAGILPSMAAKACLTGGMDTETADDGMI